MVLIRALSILCALAALAGGAGCGQSLFDANGERRDGGGGGDDGGDDGPPVPKTCPDTCIADAAADFGKSPNPWRYREAGLNHTWFDMMRNGVDAWAGTVDMGNQITRCPAGSSEPACQALPGALLVTSAGNSGVYVPALEIAATEAQVLHLIVRAHVPSGSPAQHIRLYRNSREDVLAHFSGVQGDTVERDVVVDALPGDRFLVVIEPASSSAGVGRAALQFFVSSMGESFPVTCQLAVSFQEAGPGNTLDDRCTTRELTSLMGIGGMPIAPALIAGPFAEQGNAIDLAPDRFLQGPAAIPLTRMNTPVTLQLWVFAKTIGVPPRGTLFADWDPDLGGGLEIGLKLPASPQIEVSGYSDTNPQTIVSTAGPFELGGWHFLRVVDAGGMVTVCVDGERLGSFAVPASRPETSYPVQLGKPIEGGSPANFDGAVDDVRVFSTALPCP